MIVLLNFKFMIIKGIDNQSLELNVVNYQFPENLSNKHDANWLDIEIKVDSKFGKWQTVDPSLLTFDVVKIIKFLKEVNNGSIDEKALYFLEPNLAIHYQGNFNGLARLRFCFNAEFKPVGAADSKDYYLDADFNEQQILNLLSNFEEVLENFPIRDVK